MPHTGTINFISGIYRSDCCGTEQAVTENLKVIRYKHIGSSPGTASLRSDEIATQADKQ